MSAKEKATTAAGPGTTGVTLTNLAICWDGATGKVAVAGTDASGDIWIGREGDEKWTKLKSPQVD